VNAGAVDLPRWAGCGAAGADSVPVCKASDRGWVADRCSTARWADRAAAGSGVADKEWFAHGAADRAWVLVPARVDLAAVPVLREWARRVVNDAPRRLWTEDSSRGWVVVAAWAPGWDGLEWDPADLARRCAGVEWDPADPVRRWAGVEWDPADPVRRWVVLEWDPELAAPEWLPA
jgi:hypothetical protein